MSTITDNEIWKDIPGYEGFYQASNLGRFKALPRIYFLGKNGCSKRVKGEHIMKTDINSWGYANITFMKSAIRNKNLAHRVICSLFNGIPTNGQQVNHKDGDKLNNTASNLEWVTPSENAQHSYDTGLSIKKFGKDHHNSKWVLDTQTGIFYESLKMACIAKEIAYSTLSAILSNNKPNLTGLIYV